MCYLGASLFAIRDFGSVVFGRDLILLSGCVVCAAIDCEIMMSKMDSVFCVIHFGLFVG